VLEVLPWQSVENLWDGGLKVPDNRLVTTVNVRGFEPLFMENIFWRAFSGLGTLEPKGLGRVKVDN